MITKEQATDLLYDMAEIDIFNETVKEKLHDIAQCIESLDDGLDLFGAEDDYVDLFVARANPYQSSAPYNTDELKKEYDKWVEHCNEVAEKYRIKPV